MFVMRKLVGLVLFSAFFVISSVFAQAEVIVEGLNNPRALLFDAAGMLYIAEAGVGGENTANGQFGPIHYGSTAAVRVVEQGADAPSEFIGGLLSQEYFFDFVGAAGVAFTDDTVWVLLGMGPTSVDERHSGLVGYDRETLEETVFVDLGAFERENNPDQDEIASNPNDFVVAPDGTVYIVDASANTLLSWTEADGVQVIHAWDDLPVPTTVALAEDGSLYVGFLSAYPFDRGTARIEKWVDGELAETIEGLTAITDILIAADGTIYAAQLSAGVGDIGWLEDTGKVVKIDADGTITDVATDLNFPYGLAQDADGALYVTLNSAYGAAGSGQVARIDLAE
jgi:DNA-binding beta-propeller fold protein YncE